MNATHDNWTRFYYNQLTKREQRCYDNILAARLDRKRRTNALGFTLDTLDRIVISVLADNPGLFWSHSEFLALFIVPEVFSKTVFSRYIYSAEEVADFQYRIEKETARILAQSKHCQSQIERVRFFFEYLSANCLYDGDIECYFGSQDIAGVFASRKSACAGFAHAMTYLCRKANIPCITVYGYRGEAGNAKDAHAWNIVEADGHTFNLDCVNGLFCSDTGEIDSCDVSFCMSDKTIEAAGYSPRFADRVSYPTCDWEEGEAWDGARYPHYDYNACLWKCFADVERGARESVFRFGCEEDAKRFLADFHSEHAVDDIAYHAPAGTINALVSIHPLFRAVVIEWGYGKASLGRCA